MNYQPVLHNANLVENLCFVCWVAIFRLSLFFCQFFRPSFIFYYDFPLHTPQLIFLAVFYFSVFVLSFPFSTLLFRTFMILCCESWALYFYESQISYFSRILRKSIPIQGEKIINCSALYKDEKPPPSLQKKKKKSLQQKSSCFVFL